MLSEGNYLGVLREFLGNFQGIFFFHHKIESNFFCINNFSCIGESSESENSDPERSQLECSHIEIVLD